MRKIHKPLRGPVRGVPIQLWVYHAFANIWYMQTNIGLNNNMMPKYTFLTIKLAWSLTAAALLGEIVAYFHGCYSKVDIGQTVTMYQGDERGEFNYESRRFWNIW